FVYTVTDECGREATDTQMVTIENDGPTIAAPVDAEVSCIDEVVADFENVSAMAACNLEFDVTAGDPVLVDGSGSCNGTTYTITYTVTDQCDRSESDTQTFTIVNDGLQVDEDALPQNTSVECYEDITSDPLTVYNAVTTACSTDVFVQIVPPTKACCDANCPGTEYVMTYTIIDACGDTYTHLQTFTIENDAPVLEIPADMVVTCAEDIMIDIEGATATASCDLELGDIEVGELTAVGEAGNCNGDQYTVTYSVTDECERTSTATQTFTIENDGPSVTAPEGGTVECFTDIMADTDAATGSTFCELGFLITASGPQLMEGEAECDGAVYVITYTITDDCGETATDDQMFTIENDGPMVTAPADVTVECAADAAPNEEGVTVITSCEAGFELTTEGPELVEGDGVCDGSIWKFTYTATDDCGRFASDEQLVTISNMGPTITVPEDVTLACAADAVVDTAGVMVMTSCELGYELTFEGPTLVEGDNGFCDGSVWQIVFTATDACGRTATGTQNINIENDGLALPMAPENMTVQCDEEVPEMAELVATDPCGEAVMATVTSSIVEGDCANSFTINRTWSFDDGCGEPEVLTQIIDVIDDTAPVWDEACELTSTYFTSDGVDCPADAAFSIEVGDEITTSDGYTFAGQDVPAIGTCVSDNCTANSDLIIRVADISTEGDDCEKSFVITFEAEDECGNIAGDFSCTFTVIDDVAPELFMPEVISGDISCDDVDPAQAILFGNGELSEGEEEAFLNIVRPLFIQNGLIPTGTADDCNDSEWDEIDVNVISEGLECPQVAILQCIFVAFDDCGNTSETALTQLVINSVNGPSIEAPADMEITCASEAMAMPEAAFASADCGLDFTTSVEGPNLIEGDGFCDGSVWEFVYFVTDACQRTDSSVQTVTISNNGPVITSCGPGDEVVATVDDITASIDDVMFTADCEDIDVMVTISDPEITDNGCAGLTYTYSYMVMDDCGRVDECQRTITVTENPEGCDQDVCPNFALYYINWPTNNSTVYTLYGANIVDGNAELTELSTIPYKAHIAYNETDELVYLVDQDGDFVDVFDPATGVIDMDARINLSPALGGSVTAAAYNPDNGVLYVGRGANNQIRGINLSDGSSALVVNAPVEGGDLAFVGPDLYLSTNDGPGATPNLYSVDLDAGSIMLISSIPGNQNNGMTVADDNQLLLSGDNLNAFVKVSAAGTELASFPTTLDGAPFTTGLGDLASGCNSGDQTVTPCFGAEVLDFFQGQQTNGNDVADDRSDPSKVLGAPELDNSAGSFFSLGVGGFVEIAFEGVVQDLPGNDILVVETSFSGNDCGLGDDEFADIALSQDGITWVEFGTICRNEEIDIADAGLDFVIAIRITNS
ncbi:MAG: hypothetical protein LC650_02405, partial [Actinobacteria bacterium]|nr:hypothetical protein [Actinomycetota bacterium]